MSQNGKPKGGTRPGAGRPPGPHHKFSPELAEKLRTHINSKMIINRLGALIEGQIDMAPHAVTAALGLLRKVLPDLSAIEAKIDDRRETVVRVPEPARDLTSWQQQHTPDKPTIQ